MTYSPIETKSNVFKTLGPADNGMGYVTVPKKHFLVKWNGWNREIHDISDCGKVVQEHQPSRSQLFLQGGRRGPRERQEVFPDTHKATDAQDS